MRTTISLSDGLAADVKRIAAARGLSVSALIESLVRQGLYAEQVEAEAGNFELITMKGGGVLPGVDLDRAAKIASEEDIADGLERSGR